MTQQTAYRRPNGRIINTDSKVNIFLSSTSNICVASGQTLVLKSVQFIPIDFWTYCVGVCGSLGGSKWLPDLRHIRRGDILGWTLESHVWFGSIGWTLTSHVRFGSIKLLLRVKKEKHPCDAFSDEKWLGQVFSGRRNRDLNGEPLTPTRSIRLDL